MAFRPLHDRVLVRRIEAEAKTAGGIIIPDSAKEKPQEAKVIALGTGALDKDGKKVAAIIPGATSPPAIPSPSRCATSPTSSVTGKPPRR